MGRTLTWIGMVAAIALAAWLALSITDEPSISVEDDHGEVVEYDDQGNPILSGVVGPDGKPIKPSKRDSTATAEPEDAAPLLDGQQLLTGIVLDESRRPVAGADIVAHLRDAKDVHTKSDSEGKFSLPVTTPSDVTNPWYARGTVYARTSDDRVGFSSFRPSFRLPAPGIDVGKIVVRKGAHIRCRVTREGSPVPGARYWVVGRRRAAIYETGVADDGGIVTSAIFPLSSYVVIAASPEKPDGYTSARTMGHGHKRIQIPIAKGADLPELALGDTRTLRVQVVDKASRAPIPAAKILVGDDSSRPPPRGVGTLPPIPDTLTGANGEAAVIAGVPADKRVYVNAEVEGYPKSRGYNGRGMATAEPGNDDVTIELATYREVAFPIGPSDVETPGEGDALTAERTSWSGAPDPDEQLAAKVEGTYVVISGLRPGYDYGTVSTADGRIANFHAPQGNAKAAPLKFVRAKPITLRLISESGEVMKGEQLSLAGGNGRSYQPPEITNENGEVTFDKLTWNQVVVRHVPRGSDNWWRAPIVDRFKRADVDGVREIRLKSGERVTIDVLINGVRKLPTRYSISVGRRSIRSGDVEEDPGAATLSFAVLEKDWNKSGPTKFVIGAEGCLPSTLELEREEASAGRQRVDLKLAGTFVCQVTPPEDERYSLALQQYNDGTQIWEATRASGWQAPRPADAEREKHTRRFGGLKAGTYRAIDSFSQATSGSIVVVPGEPAKTVKLDLSVVTTIEGRVVVPEGENVRTASVKRVTKSGTSSSNTNYFPGRSFPSPGRWRGGSHIQIQEDGSFSLRAVRGDPVTLSVDHAYLSPVNGKRTLRTKGGARGIEFRLEATGYISFRLPDVAAGAESVANNGPTMRPGTSITAALLADDGPGKPKKVVRSSGLIPKNGVYRIGGVEPGTYELRIDSSGFARRTIAEVKLGESSVDLGDIAMSRGGTIKVRVLPEADGDTPPSAWINCVRIDPPDNHTRNGVYGAQGVATVTGLGPGTWKLSIWIHNMFVPGGSQKPAHVREVSISGNEEVDIEHRMSSGS